MMAMMTMITMIMKMMTMMIVMKTMSAPVKKTPGAALYTRAASPGFSSSSKNAKFVTLSEGAAFRLN